MLRTKIEWCDSTANYWRGCTEVSKEESGGGGCDNCYAEAMNNWLHGGENWGPGAPRHKYDTTSRIVRSWQRQASKFAQEHGRRRRVFVNSTADTFDNEVEQAWREEIWNDICACPDLLFMVLTKRIGNARDMLPADWGDGYQNVMLLATVVNQREADRDVPKLLGLPARWHGISVEPQLGPIDLSTLTTVKERQRVAALIANGSSAERMRPMLEMLSMVIDGGESGRRARPSHPAWFRSMRDQCSAAGTAYLHKQNGEWASVSKVAGPGRHHPFPDGATMRRVGKEAAGRMLDGREHTAFPKDFR